MFKKNKFSFSVIAVLSAICVMVTGMSGIISVFASDPENNSNDWQISNDTVNILGDIENGYSFSLPTNTYARLDQQIDLMSGLSFQYMPEGNEWIMLNFSGTNDTSLGLKSSRTTFLLKASNVVNNLIINGKPWYDNNGNRIQAHGGSILFHNNTYYWYGENKEKTAPNNDIWQWGVRLYSSKDLYNWCDEGLILYPDTEDVDSPTHPSACLERPHILYNDLTKQFVMWAKVMGKDGIQYMVIFKANTIKGPFEMVRIINPCGLSSGDFDLIKEENGHAYIIFEQVHTSMIVADLTDDYMNVTGEYSRHLELSHPPFVREAPAYFIRNNKHYIFTSGTTAYLPNMSLTYSFNNFHSEFKELGNPHVDDTTDTSFFSQITSVLKVPNSDLYIALADRWVSDIKLLDGVNPTELFINMHDESIPSDKKEEATKAFLNLHNKINTSLSEYVWLPVQWKDDMPFIEWIENWKIEDYI